jgi:hypothetical protein
MRIDPGTEGAEPHLIPQIPGIDLSRFWESTEKNCWGFTGLERPSRIGACHAALFFSHPKWPVLRGFRSRRRLADRDAAWKELTRVCGDVVGGISRKLKENSEWQMELLDESKKPVFRIRLVAETLD